MQFLSLTGRVTKEGKRWDTLVGKAADRERGSLGDAVRHLQLMQLVSQCLILSLLSCATQGLAWGHWEAGDKLTLSCSILETARSSNSFAQAMSAGEQLFPAAPQPRGISAMHSKKKKRKRAESLPGLDLCVRQARPPSRTQQKSLLAEVPSNSAAACIKPGNVSVLISAWSRPRMGRSLKRNVAMQLTSNRSAHP